MVRVKTFYQLHQKSNKRSRREKSKSISIGISFIYEINVAVRFLIHNALWTNMKISSISSVSLYIAIFGV